MGQQGEKIVFAGTRQHERQADEHIAVVGPGVVAGSVWVVFVKVRTFDFRVDPGTGSSPPPPPSSPLKKSLTDCQMS